MRDEIAAGQVAAGEGTGACFLLRQLGVAFARSAQDIHEETFKKSYIFSCDNRVTAHDFALGKSRGQKLVSFEKWSTAEDLRAATMNRHRAELVTMGVQVHTRRHALNANSTKRASLATKRKGSQFQGKCWRAGEQVLQWVWGGR